MSQQRQEKSYFTFIKGLMTEATPFTYPEGSAADIDNMDLRMDGSVKRRKGITTSDAGTFLSWSGRLTGSTVPANVRFGSLEWPSPNNDPTKKFLVLRAGYYLHIYNNPYPSYTDVQLASPIATIDMSRHFIRGTNRNDAVVESGLVDMAVVKGMLVVSGTYINTFRVEYDGSSFTLIPMEIFSRDFEGRDDEYGTTERPGAGLLTITHAYNLRNHGWKDSHITAVFAGSGSTIYPSLADTYFVGYLPGGLGVGNRQWQYAEWISYDGAGQVAPSGAIVSNWLSSGAFIKLPNNIERRAITAITWLGGANFRITVTPGWQSWTAGTTQVKLHGVRLYGTDSGTGQPINYNFDTATHTGTWVSATQFDVASSVTFSAATVAHIGRYAYISTEAFLAGWLNTWGIVKRPNAIASFAGRIFYAFPFYSNKYRAGEIAFSQTVRDADALEKCYQEADPTAEELNELVDTDGGVIKISELGNVYKMIPMSRELLIFAENGVWAIGPGGNEYFTATGYGVRKLSSVGCLSPDSIVAAEGVVFYWSRTGIYATTTDPQTGLMSVQNITEKSIQTTFLSIPEPARNMASGVYDSYRKRVLWLYDSDGTTTTAEKKDKILIYDMRLGAWYVWTFKDTAHYALHHMYFLADQASEDNKLKFLGTNLSTQVCTELEVAHSTFLDGGATDAAAYITAGHELVGDVMRRKEIPYVFVYNKRLETQWLSDGGNGAYPGNPQASCMMQVRWDFADTSTGGKFTTATEVYRHVRPQVAPASLPATFDPGYDTVVTKNKVRGSGKSIQMKFSTSASKDFHLYGWAMPVAGNAGV